jgi:hypothetical protein
MARSLNIRLGRPALVIAAALAAAAGGAVVYSEGSGGACEFPDCFPDATNTGVPAGTSLSAPPSLDGENNYILDVADTTVTGIDHSADSPTDDVGCLVVRATGVTIRNSRVRCIVTESAADANGATPRLTIEDSEIDCQRNPPTADGPGTGIVWQNFDALRVDIQGCENALDMVRNASLKESYIHDMVQCATFDCVEPDSHTDGIQSGDSSGLVIEHNNISVVNLPCPDVGGVGDGRCAGTGSVNLNHAANGPSNTLVKNNLLLGGSEWIYCPGATTNWQVTGNHLSNAWTGHAPSTSNCANEDQGDNVIHETGDPVELD